jgi:hypothetical protein
MKTMAMKPDADETTEYYVPKKPLGAIKRGHKAQISITLDPELLERLTDYADENSISRPAVVAIAVSEYLSKKRKQP